MTSLPTLSVAALAECSGVDVDTIEKYQRLGLLPCPRRTSQGLALYPPDYVAHVTFTKQALALGFPAATIRDMLGRIRRKPSTCSDIYAIAKLHLADVRQQIEQLTKIEASLAPLVETCNRQGPREKCPIFTALSHQPKTRTHVADG
jgi:MerR family mercuric resistance operon transcriptional regulator